MHVAVDADAEPSEAPWVRSCECVPALATDLHPSLGRDVFVVAPANPTDSRPAAAFYEHISGDGPIPNIVEDVPIVVIAITHTRLL